MLGHNDNQQGHMRGFDWEAPKERLGNDTLLPCVVLHGKLHIYGLLWMRNEELACKCQVQHQSQGHEQ